MDHAMTLDPSESSDVTCCLTVSSDRFSIIRKYRSKKLFFVELGMYWDGKRLMQLQVKHLGMDPTICRVNLAWPPIHRKLPYDAVRCSHLSVCCDIAWLSSEHHPMAREERYFFHCHKSVTNQHGELTVKYINSVSTLSLRACQCRGCNLMCFFRVSCK